ncbi:hypothetical protein [Mucilaginibacter boryungensis]|uniref:Uncharacterized protein n=1 Tax=Mucilaginibacter boryungensis TaxID=768480 RepID=A0ABR9XEU8_9SPHI|nr:hypothetical protein [Mucilaginibacter boryungensis]MBE9665909.1 hypothetical protein [Mucilaginibacter boryungensis]
MNIPKSDSQNTDKTISELKDLQTEYPLSEKDEVKAAERKTGKLHKKAAQASKKKK